MGKFAVAIFVALMFSAAARATPGGYSLTLNPNDTGINGVTLTGNPNFLVRTAGYGSMAVYVRYTHASATAVTMTCTAGPAPAVQSALGIATVAGAVIGMANGSWSYPVTANSNMRILVSPLLDLWSSCTFAGTAAAAGDTIAVWATLGG